MLNYESLPQMANNHERMSGLNLWPSFSIFYVLYKEVVARSNASPKLNDLVQNFGCYFKKDYTY